MGFAKNLCKFNNSDKKRYCGAAKQPFNFLQCTINTVICQASSAVEPVWVHYLQLAKHTTPVSQRHSPLFCYSRGSPDTVTSLRDFLRYSQSARTSASFSCSVFSRAEKAGMKLSRTRRIISSISSSL